MQLKATCTRWGPSTLPSLSDPSFDRRSRDTQASTLLPARLTLQSSPPCTRVFDGFSMVWTVISGWFSGDSAHRSAKTCLLPKHPEVRC